MRSRRELATIGLVTALLIGACSNTSDDPVPTRAPGDQPPGASAALEEPVVLVLEDAAEGLRSWAVSPQRKTVAYVVDDGGGAELRVAGADGQATLIADASPSSYPIFLSETEIVIQDFDGRSRLRYVTTDGARLADVTESSGNTVFAGATRSELVFATTADRETVLMGWDILAGTTRRIVQIEHRSGGVDQAKVVGDYVVYRLQDGEDWRLRSTSIADGHTADLPRHDPIFGFSILGEGAEPNIVVLTEDGRDGDFIYTVDLDDPAAMTDLTTGAIAAGAAYTGDAVQYVDRAGQPRQINLTTGQISDLPPDENLRSSEQRVVGVVEDVATLAAVLPNGNWLVKGFSIEGRTYETVWNRSQAFGGGQIVNEVSAKALFEYDPVSEKLWQISGPPTFATTSTASGSGVSPSWVLRVEAMDGFIAYSTGFSGAAYDVEYNLYLAPIPSSLIG